MASDHIARDLINHGSAKVRDIILEKLKLCDDNDTELLVAVGILRSTAVGIALISLSHQGIDPRDVPHSDVADVAADLLRNIAESIDRIAKGQGEELEG